MSLFVQHEAGMWIQVAGVGEKTWRQEVDVTIAEGICFRRRSPVE